MRFVSNDSDDMFRRAASEYPLTTGNGDWSNVAAKLYGNNCLPVAATNRKRFFFAWFLLFLPAIWLCNKHTEKQLQERQLTNGSDQAMLDKFGDGKNGKLPCQDIKIRQAVLVPKGSTEQINYFADEARPKNEFVSRPVKKNLLHLTPAVKERDLLSNSPLPGTSIALPIASVLAKTVGFQPKIQLVQRADLDVDIPVRQAPSLNLKKFYIGIVSGVSVTSVKMQAIKSSGFDAGLLIGYNLSNRFHLQTGILSTQKKYYTRGEEFSTAKIRVPANTKITAVEGSCRMYEIPVSLHYLFSKKRNTWFVSGGVVNYLMQQEHYDYTYFYTNSGRSVNYGRSYRTPSKSWVAAVQFSGGFIYDIEGKFKLRASPYLQIPLKGVGTGDLPLTSAGLHIGLTKELF